MTPTPSVYANVFQAAEDLQRSRRLCRSRRRSRGRMWLSWHAAVNHAAGQELLSWSKREILRPMTLLRSRRNQPAPGWRSTAASSPLAGRSRTRGQRSYRIGVCCSRAGSKLSVDMQRCGAAEMVRCRPPWREKVKAGVVVVASGPDHGSSGGGSRHWLACRSKSTCR
ncbi:uncharacterized protein K452DRAFT_172541 [Aplosporella prunicola CBS 121167]|uniref:Uncharacterized protein n=1 Tax=Aplosporella prunicola CBS 121167 TaxID=1176127 RepID=A0A6A6AUD1_9PEZI|nr:uncharacterized protein K452DRAFT_29311 [Aplosporella prunicola CBS 121167]XP_033391330.1 uncharacterized protein K452DRAFT_172541 [Aplosporella prunicola CBS 121167]KAF2135363.1 hypothetical protein K452DRAFT_29311 [Aplosporella prunicola CBS 121167]KAF2135612.1 hypothetical protein K452DRAFT_172541 [Aplosporella prunicola CBS 121167]